MRSALREALTITLAAAVIGFAYTVATGKGFFTSRLLRSTGVSASIPSSSLKMISLQRAHELFIADSTLFIDARHEFDFKIGHIKGAINIPLATFDQQSGRVSELPKDKLLVAYCDGAQCNSSVELAAKLYEAGFRNVRIFFGGWQEWQSNHFPIETSQ